MYNCIFIYRSVEVWIFCGIYDFMHLTFLLVGKYFYFLLYYLYLFVSVWT